MTPDRRAIPTLPARDLDITAEFYERLGFEQNGRWPEFLSLRDGELELHFFAHAAVDPATTIAGCYLRVPDADAVWDRWASLEINRGRVGAPRLQGPPVVAPHGLREFALVDPDGNAIKVGSRAS